MKGASYEREIAVTLSLWYTKGKRDDVFWRSDGSGGRFTMRRKSGKDTALQSGDLTCSDPIGEPLIKFFNIECKTGYGKKKSIKNEEGDLIKKVQERWDLLDAIDSRQKEIVLFKMWSQCARDAMLTKREPILIFRRNLRSSCVMFTSKFFISLSVFFGAYMEESILYADYKESYIILPLTAFLKWTEDIQQFLTEKNRPTLNRS